MQGIYQIKQIYKGKFTSVKLSVTGIDVIYCNLQDYNGIYINYSTSDLFVCYYLPINVFHNP